MVAVNAVENIMFWPELRYAKEVVIKTDDFSYCFRWASYCATSNFSLLKYYEIGCKALGGEMNMGANLDRLIVYKRVDGRRRSLVVSLVRIASVLRSADRVRAW